MRFAGRLKCQRFPIPNSSLPSLRSCKGTSRNPHPAKTPQPFAALSELRRAHLELLQSELAKAGLDFGRLEKL
jgi:hypothetical protein